MTEGITSLIGSGVWKALEAHAATSRTLHLIEISSLSIRNDGNS